MKTRKYSISFTLKEPSSPVFNIEYFNTKSEADTWLKDNKDKLYWFQLTETNPESKFKKPILDFEPGSEYSVKSGVLQIHYETGMECTGLILYEDGIKGTENPHFDPNKPETGSNFRYYASYEAMHYIEEGQILQIEDGDKIFLIKDPDFAARDGYRLSFYPQGFSKAELVSLFLKEKIKAKLWIKK